MTWTTKPRPHVAGSPMLADYECPVHGYFEAQVKRDEHGDPPIGQPCPASVGCDNEACTEEHALCSFPSSWRISAPQLKRDSIPCYAAVTGGDTERRPGMLDTRPLAEGQPVSEWRAKQAAATQERRHHELIRKGLKTKRVQV